MAAQGSFTGDAGGEIFWQSWPAPEGDAAKGVVVIAHGVSEHSDRYAHVARRLNGAGYDAFALDHRGHGRSEGGRREHRPHRLRRRRHRNADRDRARAELRRRSCSCSATAWVAPSRSSSRSIMRSSSMAWCCRRRRRRWRPPAASSSSAGRVLSVVAPGLGVFPVDPTSVSRDPAVVSDYESDPLNYHRKLPARTVAELAGAIETFPDRLPSLTAAAAGHGRDRRPPGAPGRLADGRRARRLSRQAADRIRRPLPRDPERARAGQGHGRPGRLARRAPGRRARRPGT